MRWSKYQEAIYSAFEHGEDSLLIEAVAGSGKTTVLCELAEIMQRAFPSRRAVMVAFNKSIAMEMQARITAGNVAAMTLHSAGWAAWRRAGGLDWEPRVDSGKTTTIMRQVLTYEENKRFGETTRRLVGYAKAAGLVPHRANGSGIETNYPVDAYKGLVDDSDQAWEQLIDHYGLDPEDCSVECVRKVLARSIETMKEVCDFDDMLFAPVISGVPFDRWDVVLVDEAQDVSGIQMEMISRMVSVASGRVAGSGEYRSYVEDSQDGRVVAVGDRAQAIYGFRGAGHGSMDELKRRFGMRELPLSVSYRCPQAVVRHARQWVPQIEYADVAQAGYVGLEGTDWRGQAELAMGAPMADCYNCRTQPEREGSMYYCPSEHCPEWLATRDKDSWNKMNREMAQGGITKWRGIADFLPGDAVLCRLTRPLVAAAFALIRRRIACHVLGRDIGKGLTALIKKSRLGDSEPVEWFDRWLEDYEHREGERLRQRNKYAQAGLLSDKADTLKVFIAEAGADGTIGWLVREVEALFSDENGNGVTLATCHKAKGLEWDRVFVLDAGQFMPCPWARRDGWEYQQELNIQYVAATRAKRELRYITTADLGGAP